MKTHTDRSNSAGNLRKSGSTRTRLNGLGTKSGGALVKRTGLGPVDTMVAPKRGSAQTVADLAALQALGHKAQKFEFATAAARPNGAAPVRTKSLSAEKEAKLNAVIDAHDLPVRLDFDGKPALIWDSNRSVKDQLALVKLAATALDADVILDWPEGRVLFASPGKPGLSLRKAPGETLEELAENAGTYAQLYKTEVALVDDFFRRLEGDVRVLVTPAKTVRLTGRTRPEFAEWVGDALGQAVSYHTVRGNKLSHYTPGSPNE